MDSEAMGNRIETLSFMTNFKSLNEIEAIRVILNNDETVEYWNLKFTESCYSLIIIGKKLTKVVNILKSKGYIAEVF